MRFDWDDEKSFRLYAQRGFHFEDVCSLFLNPYLEDQKNDDPEQYFAIGFAKGVLLTTVFEYREDEIGIYIWLVTYWKATKAERALYAKNFKI